MAEEVFTGTGELKPFSGTFGPPGTDNKGIRGATVVPNRSEMPEEGSGDGPNEFFATEREYFNSLFSSCDPNNEGLVQVSKLLEVFRELRNGFENDFGPSTFEPIDALKAVLDPMDVNPLISSQEFISCVEGCVGFGFQQPLYPGTPTSSNPGSTGTSPVRRRYVKDQTETDLMNKVSELEYQVRKLSEESNNLSEQLSSVEEEKSSLLLQKNTLEKKLVLNAESIHQISTQLEDAKNIILRNQKDRDDLQGRVNFLLRENGELVTIKNQCVQESDIISNQLQILESKFQKKTNEFDTLKDDLEKEVKRWISFKGEKEREIQELHVQNYALKSQIDAIVYQKLQLERTVSILEQKLNQTAILANPVVSKSNSLLSDGPLDIESDDDSSNGIEGIPSEDGSSFSIDNFTPPGPSAACSVCSSLKDSLQAEITAVMSKKELESPPDELDSGIRKKFQQTIELIKKFKMDLQAKTSKMEKEGSSEQPLSLQNLKEMSNHDLIAFMNSEISEMQEHLMSEEIVSMPKEFGAAESSNSKLSSSTQTDGKIGSGWKKLTIFLLFAGLMCGLPKLYQFQNTSVKDIMPMDLSSVFSKYGSLTHTERPII